jgi:arabinan endo-1,5-alpha-L-arabinosidase
MENFLIQRWQMISAFSLLLLLTSLCSAQRPHAITLSGDFGGTHDPSIMKEGNTWYVFATGKSPDGGQFAVRCSQDLKYWKLCGHVFDAIPDWIQKRSPETKELWAPDISYVNHEYRLYYAYSLFGKNTSGIALATNKTLDPTKSDFKWVDKGLVFESKAEDNYNAIDPNLVLDGKGDAWLVFGSFWDGIKMRRLDGAGMLSKTDSTLYSLARRIKPENAEPAPPDLPANWEAIEAPFIVRHGNYFYLFISLLPRCEEYL